MLNHKIIFFGTPAFALPTFKALHQEGFNIVLIVTKPDSFVGRNLKLSPSPLKLAGQNLNYPITDNLIELKNKIKDLKPDLGVVVAYGKIIPQEILEAFPDGCLNLHPSLLPKYRGASPITAALLHGDQETGVTIIKLDEKMDHGPIIAQATVKIAVNDTGESLENKLSELGANLLIEILPDYLSGKIIPQAQDDQQATFTKLINKEAGWLDWSHAAEDLERQIRAFYPWPGSFTEIKLKNKILKIKILAAQITKDLTAAGDLPPAADEPSATTVGKFQQKNGRLFVRCGRGNLEILKLQPAGKKELFAKEFINGYFK